MENKDQNHVVLNVCVPSASVCALLVGMIAAPAFAQNANRAQLGVYEIGAVVQIPLDRIVPATRLEIIVDGETVTSPFGVRGETLSLTVPQTLNGVLHDIIIYEITPSGRERLGIWEFETDEGAWDYFASIHLESGIRAAGSAA